MLFSSREVLRLHVDLRDRLANPNDVLGRFLDAYAVRIGQSNGPMSIAAGVARHVAFARTYHVTAPMMTLVRKRSLDLDRVPADTRFGKVEPPFGFGFCVFDEPLSEKDVRGCTQRSVALSWGPASSARATSGSPVSGRFLVWWGHTTLAPDEVHANMVRETRPSDGLDAKRYLDFQQRLGGWTVTSVSFVPFDTPLGDVFVDASEVRLQELKAEGVSPATVYNHVRHAFALFDLMGETLTVSSSVLPVDRQTVKFAKRSRISPDITTLILRRESVPTLHPGSGSPLQHRIPVNGHNRTYHRGTPNEFTIFIRDHERGPADAPYRSTRKVHRLSR